MPSHRAFNLLANPCAAINAALSAIFTAATRKLLPAARPKTTPAAAFFAAPATPAPSALRAPAPNAARPAAPRPAPLSAVKAAVTAALITILIAPSSASAQDTGWRLDPDARIELGAVSAQTATRDDQFIVNGDAFTVRAQLGLDYEDSNSRFRVEADRIEVIRLDDDRRNTNRDRLTALFEQDLDDNWQVQARARYTDDLVTAESADTDELQGSVRVRYQKDRKHRVQVRASWRMREYDNGPAAQTDGSGLRVDAQYRRRFGRYHYATFDLRAENINSDDPRRGYERQSAKASYTQPITPDLRVRPAIEVLKTRFDNRLGSDAERRSDTLIAPEIEVHYWPGRLRVEAEAKYIFSSSNLMTREREGYRLTLSVGYAF